LGGGELGPGTYQGGKGGDWVVPLGGPNKPGENTGGKKNHLYAKTSVFVGLPGGWGAVPPLEMAGFGLAEAAPPRGAKEGRIQKGFLSGVPFPPHHLRGTDGAGTSVGIFNKRLARFDRSLPGCEPQGGK